MTVRTTAVPGVGTGIAAEPSTTPVVLDRLLLALLVTAVVTVIASLLVFTEAHRTVEAAGNTAAPAVAGVDAAHRALVDADRSAIRSALDGSMEVIGPGAQYEADITAATQSLAQVGEDNVAGDAGTQQLALVEGLVVTYTQLIQQSGAAYRASTDAGPAGGRATTGDGIAELLYASQTMHEQDNGGILYELGQLRGMDAGVLAGQRAAAWVNPFTSLVWMLPALAVLALLAWTSLFMYRQFRRIVSIPLLGAVVALVVLSVVSGLSLVSDGHFRSAQDGPFSTMAALSASQADVTDADGQASLAALIAGSCDDTGGACAQAMQPVIQPSVETIQSDLADMPTVPGSPSYKCPIKLPGEAATLSNCARALAIDDYQAAEAVMRHPTAGTTPPAAGDGTSLFTAMSNAWAADQKDYQSRVSVAGAAFGVRLTIIAVMAVLVLALILFSIQPRINEYRYRSR